MSQSADLRRDRGQAGPLVLVLVMFTVLAALVYVNNQNPEIRRINLVAQQYADAWRTGQLADLEYDPLSHPEVGNGDPQRVADNVAWIVHYLDESGQLRPEKIEIDRAATQRTANDLATARAWVTWKLHPTGLEQSAYYWTYPVTIQERLFDGRWRVVWTPQTVHPQILHGLAMRLDRSLPSRASVLGAGDAVLYPVAAGTQPLARSLLGAIANQATYEQALLADLRAEPNDTVGISGLQKIYDERLAGGAGVKVVSYVVRGFGEPKSSTKPEIGTVQQPLFVGPPETPKPLKTTLDGRTQGWAQTALAGVAGNASLVVVKPSTGDLLAVANTRDDDPIPAKTTDDQQRQDHDYGLSSQQPPGPVFGLIASLALLRSGYTTTTRIDCSDRYTFAGQVFENTQGPKLAGVTLGAAVEGGCSTGLARSAADVLPADLRTAAYDLGVATPRDSTADTPGWLQVADQLGTPAFHGQLPVDDDPLHHVENMVGEGRVLASPLSMARAAATVASGTRRAVRLIVDPPAGQPDLPKSLAQPEVQALQEIMSKGVTEPGGSAHALASLGDVHALAGTAGYGTGKGQRRQAWCVGYLGEYAFAVLVPDVTGDPSAGRGQALAIASKFLDAAR